MKVLVIGKFDKESFASHIVQTLTLNGHQVVPLQYGVQYRHSGFMYHTRTKIELVAERTLWNTVYAEKKFMKRLDKTINGHDIQLTIVCHDFLRPGEVSFIRQKTNAPVVLWFPDAVVNFGKHMFLNAPFDALFFKDPFIVDRLSKEFPSKRFYYLPECCNPHIHRIYSVTEEQRQKYSCDITTAGNLYANRVLFFQQLAKTSFDIKIWGNPPSRWMDVEDIRPYIQQEFIMENEKGAAFQLAKIVLNNLHPAEVNSINCRAFEIPALGGFQLISWRESIAELFEPGEEVATYSCYDELLDKLQYYTTHETERQQIIRKGHERVNRDHTYAKRLTEMCETLDLKF